ncbi:hypothetical protein U0070_013628 [Myodes glareolus]|uniref:Uncharacterized protein n=1 Tax=Myodes glareolus TaxID=447135 RepID=A0AAW0JM20_MYOGA
MVLSGTLINESLKLESNVIKQKLPINNDAPDASLDVELDEDELQNQRNAGSEIQRFPNPLAQSELAR